MWSMSSPWPGFWIEPVLTRMWSSPGCCTIWSRTRRKTLPDVEQRFGRVVAELVAHCSEIKTDDQGRKRPWIDRKSDHLAALREAPAGARAILLADKLHNLISIDIDLREGRPVWNEFHAGRDQVLWYYHAIIAICVGDSADSRLQQVAARCREALEEIETLKR